MEIPLVPRGGSLVLNEEGSRPAAFRLCVKSGSESRDCRTLVECEGPDSGGTWKLASKGAVIWTLRPSFSTQKMEVGKPGTTVQIVGQNTLVVFVRSDPQERSKRNHVKKEGSRVAIKQLKNHFKRSNVCGHRRGTLDTDGQAECVNNLLLCQEDRTVEVHQWITELPYDAFLRVGDSVSGRQAGS